MTKKLLIVCICAILTTSSATSFAQKLSFGEYTGINFSNLHGNLTTNKWVSKPGPSAGFSVEYNLGRLFSVQSEIGFISQYYEMKSYDQKYSYPIVYPMDDAYHGYYNTWDPVSEPFKWDFSFLRFPLLINYKTPTRLQLSFGVGVFYSVLLNDKLTKDERNTAEKDNRNVYPPAHDWGYMVSADLSYPVTNNMKLYFAGRLTTGQKVFIESYKAKNGASELIFGLKYTPQRKTNKTPIDIKSSEPDSSITRCYIIPATGVIMSWNLSGTKPGNYSGKFGPSVGMIFGYRLDKSVSIQTGLLFDRKGYALNDTSLYFHRFASDSRYVANKVDTKIALDYLTVPFNSK